MPNSEVDQRRILGDQTPGFACTAKHGCDMQTLTCNSRVLVEHPLGAISILVLDGGEKRFDRTVILGSSLNVPS